MLLGSRHLRRLKVRPGGFGVGLEANPEIQIFGPKPLSSASHANLWHVGDKPRSFGFRVAQGPQVRMGCGGVATFGWVGLLAVRKDWELKVWDGLKRKPYTDTLNRHSGGRDQMIWVQESETLKP